MSNRLRDIVTTLAVRPGDSVLEIGCGQGLAADLICERLERGHLLGIDRSARMIAAARLRNARHMARGCAAFVCVDLESFDPGERRFDLVLAVRVGLFHREPKRFDAIVRPWLKPRGRLVAIYDQPGLKSR